MSGNGNGSGGNGNGNKLVHLSKHHVVGALVSAPVTAVATALFVHEGPIPTTTLDWVKSNGVQGLSLAAVCLLIFFALWLLRERDRREREYRALEAQFRADLAASLREQIAQVYSGRDAVERNTEMKVQVEAALTRVEGTLGRVEAVMDEVCVRLDEGEGK